MFRKPKQHDVSLRMKMISWTDNIRNVDGYATRSSNWSIAALNYFFYSF